MGRARSKKEKDYQRLRAHKTQIIGRINTIIRGPTFYDREKCETIATQYGSVTIEDRFIWTEPGEVLNDPYGRGTLERIK